MAHAQASVILANLILSSTGYSLQVCAEVWVEIVLMVIILMLM
jgi:hypothetical protein